MGLDQECLLKMAEKYWLDVELKVAREFQRSQCQAQSPSKA